MNWLLNHALGGKGDPGGQSSPRLLVPYSFRSSSVAHGVQCMRRREAGVEGFGEGQQRASRDCCPSHEKKQQSDKCSQHDSLLVERKEQGAGSCLLHVLREGSVAYLDDGQKDGSGWNAVFRIVTREGSQWRGLVSSAEAARKERSACPVSEGPSVRRRSSPFSQAAWLRAVFWSAADKKVR